MDLNDQYVTLSVWYHAKGESESFVRLHDFDGRSSRRQRAQGIFLQPFDLNPKPEAVRYYEAKIPDPRNIDPWMIDFVEDSKPEGKPHPRWPETATPMSLALLVQVGGMPG
jgi:hypothetical protein